MKIDVKRNAELANLLLKDSEIQKFEMQLSEILQYFKKLDEVDVSEVQPMGPPIGPKPLRDDKTNPSLSQENALQNTISKHNGFFKVKAILE